ncbi:phosphotransferase family protein [Virgibacillus oceani]|nr:aminoglycoside phosphotransferase family protein [Virgibacillus oceani]
MLKPFFKDQRILQIQVLSGGLNNSNLRITTDANESYVLRIYSKENNSSMEIEREILTILKDKVPVPNPLYSDSSCTNLDYPYVLLSWIQGYQLSELLNEGNQNLISNAAKEAGSLLAKVHSVTFPSSGFFNENLHIQDHVKLDANHLLMYIKDSIIKGRAATRLSPDLAKRIYQFAKKHAHLIDCLNTQNSLVHGDFNPLNILAETSTRSISITGLLDWEYAFSGTPLMDIGNMLRYEDVRHTQFLASFILSYQNNRGILPEKWLQKAKLLDLIALCSLLDKKECGEIRMRDIIRLILNMMQDWESYNSIQNRLS